MSDDNDLLMVLGEIRGELKGIRELVHASGESTNRRVDDLNKSINSRLEDHQDATDTRFKDIRQEMNKKSSLIGGGTSAIVAGIIEMLKRALG